MARDAFWELLVDLSRRQGVTIFVSTHFMNEAARCDRISLMHAGRILATGAPAALVAARGAASLDEAFVGYLEEAAGDAAPAVTPSGPDASAGTLPAAAPGLRRLFAIAYRESLELLRDRVRLGFALFGTMLLMLVFGFGITMDVESLSFAALDRDGTPESRAYIQEFAGSRYFVERPPIADGAALERRLRSGELRLAIEIPPGFGRDVIRGRPAEVSAWIDGAMPFRAETVQGYVQGVHQGFLAMLAQRRNAPPAAPVATIETRFRYNQDFKSLYAMVPGTIAILLVFIPAILTALGVVREKELGSITNLYVTPTRRHEFLLGKQLPYILLSMLNLRPAGGDRGPAVRRAAEGKPDGTDPGGAALCHGDDRHRPADVRLHPDPDRRPVRHRHPHHGAGAAVLRPDRADLDADRCRCCWDALPHHLFPPRQRRRVHQGTRPARPAADPACARRLHPRADRAQHRGPAQAGALRDAAAGQHPLARRPRKSAACCTTSRCSDC